MTKNKQFVDRIIPADLSPDNLPRPVHPANVATGYRLEELYKLLNCQMIQVIYPNTVEFPEMVGKILICDEEILLRNSNPPYNEFASMFAGTDIYGDVLLCKSENLK